MADNNVIVGVFYGREQAQAAIRDLQQEGFRDIGYVEREDDETTRALPTLKEKQDDRKQTLYLIVGGIVGAVLGLLFTLILHILFIFLGIVLTLAGMTLGACTGMLTSLFSTRTPTHTQESSTAAALPDLLRAIVIVQSDVRAVEAYTILARHRPLNDAAMNVVARDRLHDPEATIEMRKQDLNGPQRLA